MICFGINDHEYGQCDTFDGTSVGSLPKSSQRHHWGCLAHYNDHPTAVGGYVPPTNLLGYPKISKVESFDGHSWSPGTDHPRYGLNHYNFYAILVLSMDIIASLLEMLCSLLEVMH